VDHRRFPDGLPGAQEPAVSSSFTIFRMDRPSPSPRPSRVGPASIPAISYFALYGRIRCWNTAADPYSRWLPLRAPCGQPGSTGVWLAVAAPQARAGGPWQPERSTRRSGSGWKKPAGPWRFARGPVMECRCTLYLNEPRALPLTFFSRGHPELKGRRRGRFTPTLCTSLPVVRRFPQGLRRGRFLAPFRNWAVFFHHHGLPRT